ncbi:dna double-strand break repair and vj recombination xrcc4 [Trichoderma arundinaceum]|uniref:Dna double-strand break repair and vj recombination xrcc4 n=1 Tax=Trichoderma arundinaceum TaxID=490622 RepID=A0A395P063_TRIAR|nr:dna double-strand break repair and vj recombination xrcc4 [Trichoderma arundinaceum]
MTASRVIKLPRDDNESTYALIQVIQKGSKPLDVKLVGTEGEAPYVTSLKHDRVASLQVTNCPVSESEWQTILISLFSLQPASDIQATASINSETSLTITVRKRVQGITQRLGSIELKHDEDEGIELFAWCAESIDALAQSNVALAEAAAHAKELETTVAELKAQLDELVTAKQEDETTLLLKFRDLLNEKKVKIREQQKVLAAGPLLSSQSASQRLSQPLDSEPSHTPAPSRPRKRKVQAVVSSSNEPDENEMEVDKIKIEPQDSEPEDTAEDTASGGSDDDDGNEDEDEDDSNGRGSTSGSGVGNSSKAAPKGPQPPKKKAEDPPPPRSLPFTRKAAAAKAPAAGNETESDDEL